MNARLDTSAIPLHLHQEARLLGVADQLKKLSFNPEKDFSNVESLTAILVAIQITRESGVFPTGVVDERLRQPVTLLCNPETENSDDLEREIAWMLNGKKIERLIKENRKEIAQWKAFAGGTLQQIGTELGVPYEGENGNALHLAEYFENLFQNVQNTKNSSTERQAVLDIQVNFYEACNALVVWRDSFEMQEMKCPEIDIHQFKELGALPVFLEHLYETISRLKKIEGERQELFDHNETLIHLHTEAQSTIEELNDKIYDLSENASQASIEIEKLKARKLELETSIRDLEKEARGSAGKTREDNETIRELRAILSNARDTIQELQPLHDFLLSVKSLVKAKNYGAMLKWMKNTEKLDQNNSIRDLFTRFFGHWVEYKAFLEGKIQEEKTLRQNLSRLLEEKEELNAQLQIKNNEAQRLAEVLQEKNNELELAGRKNTAQKQLLQSIALKLECGFEAEDILGAFDNLINADAKKEILLKLLEQYLGEINEEITRENLANYLRQLVQEYLADKSSIEELTEEIATLKNEKNQILHDTQVLEVKLVESVDRIAQLEEELWQEKAISQSQNTKFEAQLEAQKQRDIDLAYAETKVQESESWRLNWEAYEASVATPATDHLWVEHEKSELQQQLHALFVENTPDGLMDQREEEILALARTQFQTADQRILELTQKQGQNQQEIARFRGQIDDLEGLIANQQGLIKQQQGEFNDLARVNEERFSLLQAVVKMLGIRKFEDIPNAITGLIGANKEKQGVLNKIKEKLGTQVTNEELSDELQKFIDEHFVSLDRQTQLTEFLAGSTAELRRLAEELRELGQTIKKLKARQKELEIDLAYASKPSKEDQISRSYEARTVTMQKPSDVIEAQNDATQAQGRIIQLEETFQEIINGSTPNNLVDAALEKQAREGQFQLDAVKHLAKSVLTHADGILRQKQRDIDSANNFRKITDGEMSKMVLAQQRAEIQIHDLEAKIAGMIDNKELETMKKELEKMKENNQELKDQVKELEELRFRSLVYAQFMNSDDESTLLQMNEVEISAQKQEELRVTLCFPGELKEFVTEYQKIFVRVLLSKTQPGLDTRSIQSAEAKQYWDAHKIVLEQKINEQKRKEARDRAAEILEAEGPDAVLHIIEDLRKKDPSGIMAGILKGTGVDLEKIEGKAEKEIVSTKLKEVVAQLQQEVLDADFNRLVELSEVIDNNGENVLQAFEEMKAGQFTSEEKSIIQKYFLVDIYGLFALIKKQAETEEGRVLAIERADQIESKL